jgi:hypothetical protein
MGARFGRLFGRIPERGWSTTACPSPQLSLHRVTDLPPANCIGLLALPEVAQPATTALPVPRRLRSRYVVALAITTLIAAILAADRWLRVTTTESFPSLPVPATSLFAEPVPIVVTVSARGNRAPWTTTEGEVRNSVEQWKRMDLEDWNAVQPTLRKASLDNMLRRYANIFNNPAAWDRMSAFDWDAVPQPIRTVAYRRMVAYWSGFYDVGSAFDLPAGRISETLAAIVMSESWFDHRARSVNRDGSWDVGLGQASFFARQRLRELYDLGRVDAALTEHDYDNPWMATRFVALWMNLMLEESDGDLERAVRAYNRGIADAHDRLGTAYFDTVQQRLSRYIWNVDAPPSWDYVWRHSREVVRTSTVGAHEWRTQ